MKTKVQARMRKKGIAEDSIAFKIKELRVNSNLTQEDLAIACGISLSFIRDLEQGKLTLMLHKVIQVAKFLGAEISVKKRNSYSTTTPKEKMKIVSKNHPKEDK